MAFHSGFSTVVPSSPAEICQVNIGSSAVDQLQDIPNTKDLVCIDGTCHKRQHIENPQQLLYPQFVFNF